MRWSYKTVHFSLKKEGLLGSAFLDEEEIEESLNEYGTSGWELVSFMEVNDGLIAIFKQPFGEDMPILEEADTNNQLPEDKQLQDYQHQDHSVCAVEAVTPEIRTQVSPPSFALSQQNSVADTVMTQKKEINQKKESDDADVGSIRIA